MLQRAGSVAGALGLFAACTAVYVPLLVVASRMGLVERFRSGDRGPVWIGLTVGHVAQAAVCIAIIALVMRSPLSEWGMNMRNSGSSLRWVGWFLIAWIPVLGTVNVLIPLITRVPPSFALPLRAVDVAGWLVFQFVIVGFTEEILFRGLVQTYLARTFSGTIGPIPTAGIVSTLVFCVAHFYPRIHWPQQVFAAGLGLVYATAYHRTGSLAAPIAIHNISDGTATVAMWAVRAWMTR